VKGTLGHRLGRSRRHRLAYLALLRRSRRYGRRAAALRAVALAVTVVLVLPSDRRWPALLLCLPAAAAAALWLAPEDGRRPAPGHLGRLLAAHRRNQLRVSGEHRLPAGAYPEILGGLLLVALPCWVVGDLPAVLRLVLLAAGVAHLSSTSLSIFVDHTWFNPAAPDPPAWHEVLRRVAGPFTAGLVAAVALPAPWPPQAWSGVVVLTATPLLIGLRIADTDLTVAQLAPLVAEESHTGRELVLAETHGALSTHLRLLEQEARAHRDTAPTLYELAVGASFRLRETLALHRPGEQTSTSPATLAAPVLTLARAVGAAVDVEVTTTELSGPDRNLVRLVLSDLVGNALNAGAMALHVRVGRTPDRLTVRVADDAAAMPAGVWKTPGTSSAQLESRLAEQGGSLSVTTEAKGKAVTAVWVPRHETGTGP
jgi:signal transduction histidine kinase